ncbi:dTMP kinase [Lactiplantibacillus plantarum]|uniref:dTMP kinase n=1 Tax=Lactiplantibacillus plantarum TaxID=1590 RepID=UPI000C7FB2B5|nr:hypothetical protein [Lactiplantibacillus plantarum]PME02604.1 dTMP kinase [Lactiplantibacillus plantarum subsp. plantarum]
MRSFFITIEGMDGSGKSTIIPELAERFRENLFRTKMWLRLKSQVGQRWRRYSQNFAQCKNNKIDIRTEVLLFAASRRQHVVEKIIPTLKSGGIVISDRFLIAQLFIKARAVLWNARCSRVE